jgi:hypothetical protein
LQAAADEALSVVELAVAEVELEREEEDVEVGGVGGQGLGEEGACFVGAALGESGGGGFGEGAGALRVVRCASLWV